ncbi:MAG: sigma-70 family RNA polymerase sigma factor [Planctomycetes bacterium]|nr:sigma-70 family RNA polymerase sigma factor [Planctomycetota bacterium]
MTKPKKNTSGPQPAPVAEQPPAGGETQFLVREAVSGEAARAWTALSAKIVYYLRTRFGNCSFPPGTEFHDFVSDLMAKVMTSIHNYEDRGHDSFWRWVQTIGGNVWRDMWRRFDRDRRLGLVGRGETAAGDGDANPGSIVANAPAGGETPTGIVRFRELERAEQECAQQLPKQMRAVYEMRRQRELSFAEISAELGGIKEVTLRSHYMRARDLVRECLATKVDELGKRVPGWTRQWV